MTYNLRDTMGYRLGRLARRWRQEVDHAVKVLDMTEATWRPLLHLSHLDEAVRQKDLAESMGTDGSSLVRLLDNLEERGLIRREDGADRRCKLVTLTPAGRAATAQARAVVTALEHELLGALNDDHIGALGRMFDHIDAALDRHKEGRGQPS